MTGYCTCGNVDDCPNCRRVYITDLQDENDKLEAELKRFRDRELTLQALLVEVQQAHISVLTGRGWDLLALVRDFKVTP